MNRTLRNCLSVCLLSILASGRVCAAEDAAPARPARHEFRARLSELPSCEPKLGEGWHGPSGLVVDDVDDLSALDQAARLVAESLAKQLKPLGIKAFADYTYTRRDSPRIVTVRVFVFKDSQAAQAWWKTKYEHPGWEKFYEKTSGLGDQSVKSTETRKEMALEDNVWLTSHQLHEGQEYHAALVHYLKHVAPTKPAAAP